MLKRLLRALKDPKYTFQYLIHRGNFDSMPDEEYIKLMFNHRMGYELDLANPRTFNEKLQWLKLYDRKPEYTIMVDKYEVRKYISDKIGEDYLVPLIGVWDKFGDIDFNKLPNQFVLKCTHDSGGVVICQDKKHFNVESAKEKLNKSLKSNYYYAGREWPYKNVKPRIICEELLKTQNNELPDDYKFFCFHGKPDNVMVCIERETGSPKFYFFNNDWELLRYNIAGKNAPPYFTLPKPKKMDEMFEVAEKISKGLPFSRIDLYYENDKIYFGEITFFPQSGYDKNLLEETDLLFGSKINLEKI